jgi:hypothetical protein
LKGKYISKTERRCFDHLSLIHVLQLSNRLRLTKAKAKAKAEVSKDISFIFFKK